MVSSITSNEVNKPLSPDVLSPVYQLNGLEKTRQLKKRFLELFIETNNVSESCKLTGIMRSTVYQVWQATDPEFCRAFQDADLAYRDKLVKRVDERAMLNDTMLMFRVKQKDPSFRDNPQIQVNNSFPEIKVIEICATERPQQVVLDSQKQLDKPQQVVEGECKELTGGTNESGNQGRT